jgi:glycosyltransferase involved in cell wall biosynthesis
MRENNLRIIYILNDPTKYGGANKSFINMIDGLIEKGIVPSVMLPFRGGICDLLDERNVSYFIVPFFLSIYPKIYNFRDLLMFFPRILRMVYLNQKAVNVAFNFGKKINVNLIHTNVGPLHIGKEISKKLGVCHVWHIREYQDLDFGMTPLFSMKGFLKKINSPNNYNIAITKDLFNHFQMSKDNSKIIYNGVLSNSQIKFNPYKKKYFLYAGRVTEMKGFGNLLVAYNEFAKENKEYDLYVAGQVNEVYLEKLRLLISEFGIEQRVHFLGERDDVYGLMEEATALIVPSLYEGFGRITAEAMFNGCLVIGYNSGGTKEILEKDNLGLLYSNQEELVNSMKIVVSKGIDYFFPLIHQAQKRAVECYSNEQNVANVFNYYMSFLTSNNKDWQ